MPFYLVVVCAWLAGLLFLVLCSSLPDLAVVPPWIEGAHFVGNPKCAECHGEIARLFPGSVLTRVFSRKRPGFERLAVANLATVPEASTFKPAAEKAFSFTIPAKIRNRVWTAIKRNMPSFACRSVILCWRGK